MQLGLSLRVIADVDSLLTLRRAAAAGLAVTILPMAARSDGDETELLVTRRLTGPGISRPVSLGRSDALPPTAASATVAAVLREQTQALVASSRWQGVRLWTPAGNSLGFIPLTQVGG